MIYYLVPIVMILLYFLYERYIAKPDDFPVDHFSHSISDYGDLVSEILFAQTIQELEAIYPKVFLFETHYEKNLPADNIHTMVGRLYDLISKRKNTLCNQQNSN